jgi:hypothetical protein
MGEVKFGLPDDATRAFLGALADPEKLEELGCRLLKAKSWQELLAEPILRRRKSRRGPAGKRRAQ